MGIFVKNNDIYKHAFPYVRVGGVWKFSPESWVKQDGTWRNFFLTGGLNDQLFNSTFDTKNLVSTYYNVNDWLFQTDGKLVLVGDFSSYNGVFAPGIVRLNADSTVDTDFSFNLGRGFEDGSFLTLTAVAIQSDGKILVGGQFSTVNGVGPGTLARLNANGSLDTAFSTNLGTGTNSGSINKILVQPNGQILIGSGGDLWNGVTVARGLVRLSSAGVRDTTFSTNMGTGVDGFVHDLYLDSNSRIIVAGSFETFNGTVVNNILRLNSTGTRDTTANFGTGFTGDGTGTDGSGQIEVIVPQSDGKVLVGGWFKFYKGVAITSPQGFIRLNADFTTDTAFMTNLGTGFTATNNVVIRNIVLQSDGAIVVAGVFLTFNGTEANGLVRLNSSGTKDTSFVNTRSQFLNNGSIAIRPDGRFVSNSSFAGTSAQTIIPIGTDGTLDNSVPEMQLRKNGFNYPNDVKVQSDSKILVAGDYEKFQWPNSYTAYPNLVRLNSNSGGNIDLQVDATFMTNLGTGPNNFVSSIALQQDGKILLCGGFTSINGTACNRVARINQDGTLDTSFIFNVGTGANNTVQKVVVQPDGKIIVAGSFTSFNGATINRIVRLNSNGTTDLSFSENIGTGASGTILNAMVQSNGGIILTGSFASFAGVTCGRIARLTSSGTLDASFRTNTGTGSTVNILAVAEESDGKILLGGEFSTFNGIAAPRLIRLNSDGTRDTDFVSALGTGTEGADRAVLAISVHSINKKITVGGQFSSFNGSSVGRIVRLNIDGTLDTAFRFRQSSLINGNQFFGGASGVVNRIAEHPDGSLILTGTFGGYSNDPSTGICRIGGELSVV
jgi:uncharacterized delta-60 repeat protein